MAPPLNSNFEKRNKPATLLYLILITVLLIMISVVILTLLLILGRNQTLSTNNNNNKNVETYSTTSNYYHSLPKSISNLSTNSDAATEEKMQMKNKISSEENEQRVEELARSETSSETILTNQLNELPESTTTVRISTTHKHSRTERPQILVHKNHQHMINSTSSSRTTFSSKSTSTATSTRPLSSSQSTRPHATSLASGQASTSTSNSKQTLAPSSPSSSASSTSPTPVPRSTSSMITSPSSTQHTTLLTTKASTQPMMNATSTAKILEYRSSNSGQSIVFNGRRRNNQPTSVEPISAVQIDFENADLEIDDPETQHFLQTTQNTTEIPKSSTKSQPIPTSTTTIHSPSSDTTVTSTVPSTSTSSSTTTPATTTTTTTNLFESKLAKSQKPKCVKRKAQKCSTAVQRNSMSRDDIPNESQASEVGHFGGLKAVNYALNIAVNQDIHTSYQGSVEIMFEVVENTSTVFVHVGRAISDVGLAQIELWNCLDGSVICVSSMVQHLHLELVSIDLVKPVLTGQFITLRISGFGSNRPNNALIVQNPPRWQPKRPWTVTTLFQMRDARSVMPCIDLPFMKATLDICITHPPGTEARSNTPLLRQNVLDDKKIESCFETTPPMSTYLYGFALFNRMINIQHSADRELSLPQIDILYPQQMSSDKPIWMQAESIQILQYMSEFTGFDYPLKKLSLFSTSLPVNGVENFGLIVLNERWMAYPKYRMAHSILAHEIAHQWIGNIVTVKKWNEICLQEGLTTYLESLITAKLDNTTNISESFADKMIEAIARDTKSSEAIISDFRTYEDIFRCFDKPAIFFVMLQSGFGEDVVKKFSHLLIQKYAYGNAGVVEWHDLIVEAAQNKLAGQFFNQYFTEPGVPLVRVAYQPDGVLLKQETIVAAKKTNNTSSLVIPLELQTDRVKEAKQILFTAKEETFALKHNGMVVVDPHRKTYAVVVYEAQIYSRLLQCAQTNACAVVNSQNMRYIAEDFCWTFLNDLIEVNDEMPTDQVKVWSEFMRLLSLTPYVKGSCACCLDKNLTKSFNVPCKWHWKDRCEHIRLVRKVQSFRNNNI